MRLESLTIPGLSLPEIEVRRKCRKDPQVSPSPPSPPKDEYVTPSGAKVTPLPGAEHSVQMAKDALRELAERGKNGSS
jgi:hypothetical protein